MRKATLVTLPSSVSSACHTRRSLSWVSASYRSCSITRRGSRVDRIREGAPRRWRSGRPRPSSGAVICRCSLPCRALHGLRPPRHSGNRALCLDASRPSHPSFDGASTSAWLNLSHHSPSRAILLGSRLRTGPERAPLSGSPAAVDPEVNSVFPADFRTWKPERRKPRPSGR